MENDIFGDRNFSYKTKVGCLSRFRRSVRSADMYARPITLRYKDEKKFRTNFGACTSITLFLVVAFLFASGLRDMLEH